ncbi:MAG: DUF2804 domain-containing protein [bacterium]
MKREIQESPESIVRDGRILNGIFRKPIRNMNFGDVKWPGGFIEKSLRSLKLKEWLGFTIEHPDWHLIAFMQDAKCLASSNLFAYDRRNNTLITYERNGLPGAVRMAANLLDDRSEHVARGYIMEFYSHIDAGEHTIRIEIEGTCRKPGVSAEIVLTEDLSSVQPFVASFPLRGNNNMFTHKAPMPASGWFKIGGEKFEYDPSRDIAIMDEHKSYFPYITVWQWATFAGYDAAGRLIGVNIGVHETIEDQEKHNENCLWIGNKMELLGAAAFEFDPKRRMEPWKIRELNGRAELTFYPQGDKVKNVSLGIMDMKYFQPCGFFRGYIIDDNGERIEINDMYGVAEMMDSRW